MRALLGGVAVLLLAGCAGDGTTRIAAFGDDVGAVDASNIVGAWRCEELNRPPGVPIGVFAMNYAADGRGTTRSSGSSPVAGMGQVILDSTFEWKVEGSRIVQHGVRTRALPADAQPSTAALAQLTQKVVDEVAADSTARELDVRRLDDLGMVVVPADVPEAPTFACSRVKGAAPPQLIDAPEPGPL